MTDPTPLSTAAQAVLDAVQRHTLRLRALPLVTLAARSARPGAVPIRNLTLTTSLS